MGFLDSIGTLLGGFNDVKQIDSTGFDFREKRRQEELARQQQQQEWEQSNAEFQRQQEEADIAGLAEASLAPGATPESVESGLKPDVQGARRKFMLDRAAGRSLQSKSTLADAADYRKRLMRSDQDAAAMAREEYKAKTRADLMKQAEEIRSNQQMSPREKDAAMMRIKAQLQLFGAAERGRNDRFDRAQENGVVLVDQYDPVSGETQRVPVSKKRLGEMARENEGGPGSEPPADGKAANPLLAFRKPPSANIQLRENSAHQSLKMADDIEASINTPDVAAQLGPIMGRYKTLEIAAGAGDPVAVKLKAQLWGFASMQMALHNARNYKIAQDALNLLKSEQTPESLIAAVQGITGAARAIVGERATGGGGAPRQIRSQAEWDALPSGARYIKSNGRTAIKP